MTAADASREAYAKVFPKLDTLRFHVCEAICQDPGLDDISYAKMLNKDINCITPRIGELEKAGLISTEVKAKNVRGNTARRSFPRRTA